MVAISSDHRLRKGDATRRTVGLALCALLATGCDAPPAPATASLGFEEVLRVGTGAAADGASGPTFGQVPSIAPDGEGGVWVLDGAVAQVVHVDAAGRETVRFGDFVSPRRLYRAGDTIWVEELGAPRWSAWSSDGAPLATVALPPELAGGEADWTADGLVAAVQRRDAEGTLLRWAERWRPEGDAFVRVDSFAPPPVPEPFALQTMVVRQGREVGLSFPLPLAHQPAAVVHPDGDRWVITPGGGEYRVEITDLTGAPIRELRRDFAAVPVPDGEREAAVERLPVDLRETQATRVPTHYPPFDRVVVADNGAFWLVRSTGAASPSFDLFDAAGQFQGTVEGAPELAGFWLHAADDSGVWGVRRDEEGRPVVLRLEWTRD